jgi:hypothetical protein
MFFHYPLGVDYTSLSPIAIANARQKLTRNNAILAMPEWTRADNSTQ